MAKKRKGAPQSREPEENTEIDPRDSRKRIRTYEDVADSDDEFHLQQDEIRLGEKADVKRRRKTAEAEDFIQQSDEEVLGYSEEEASDEEEPSATGRQRGQRSDSEGSDGGGRHDEEEDDFRWGTSKSDLYGADAIETEEQALEEEAEAIRLQKKRLLQMNAADYGFDEDDWQQAETEKTAEDDLNGDIVTEVLPQLQIAPDMSSAERLKLLKSRYPEFEPLSKDLLRLQEVHSSLLKNPGTSDVARVKLRAATAYLGALVMYFSLLTSTASKSDSNVTALPASKLRDHPVMDTLVKCRELWMNVESMTEGNQRGEAGEPVSDVEAVSDLDAASDAPSEEISLPKPTKRKSRAERHAEAVKATADKLKAERLQRTEADLADLDDLIASSNKKFSKKSRPVETYDDSDLGEEAPLTAREAEDKAKRKKSLRFYTSQIAQKANKRGTAGRNAGGDDDIPYRERLKDRQARLNAEAEKRGKRGDGEGADLGDDSDDEDRRQARQIRADADEDDYYDLVAARTSKKKSDKAALAEAQKQAALQGGQVVQEEVVGEDGKRKISYAIEKNKGLTPHRKKDVRNPRVKKRKKYDEKKKKLASIKPVYKGGEGRGGYGGELTGIKKGLVKSTKLS